MPCAGRLRRSQKADVIPTLDWTRVNIIAGPVYVDGAEPGDTLKVTLLGFEPSGWAWTGIIPGFGYWPRTSSSRHCTFGHMIDVQYAGRFWKVGACTVEAILRHYRRGPPGTG